MSDANGGFRERTIGFQCNGRGAAGVTGDLDRDQVGGAGAGRLRSLPRDRRNERYSADQEDEPLKARPHHHESSIRTSERFFRGYILNGLKSSTGGHLRLGAARVEFASTPMTLVTHQGDFFCPWADGSY
jgi:hypothetical protein